MVPGTGLLTVYRTCQPRWWNHTYISGPDTVQEDTNVYPHTVGLYGCSNFNLRSRWWIPFSTITSIIDNIVDPVASVTFDRFCATYFLLLPHPVSTQRRVERSCNHVKPTQATGPLLLVTRRESLAERQASSYPRAI